MKTFKIDLDNFCEQIFYAMESMSEGVLSHELVISGDTKEQCIEVIFLKLKPFFCSQLKMVK